MTRLAVDDRSGPGGADRFPACPRDHHRARTERTACDVPTIPAETTSMRTRLCGVLGVGDVGSTVTVCGWVAKRREHGEHLAFVDLRDHTGIVQCVIPGTVDVRSEYVIAVEGVVRHRPEGTVNPELPTGEVELGDCTVTVLNPAEPPPFAVDDRVDVDEVDRLRYRFVDLRRPRMQSNLRLRAVVNRRPAGGHGPPGVRARWRRRCCGRRPRRGPASSPCPSRLSPGFLYVLPQSPQLAKQLLMVAGVDRYYQIARCLRDEDLRADRQFEFSQLDVEASFVGQEDVLELRVRSRARRRRGGHRRCARPDIPRMTWAEAIDRYGTDKPDLRFGMELIDLSPLFEGTEVKAFGAPCVKALRARGRCLPEPFEAGRPDRPGPPARGQGTGLVQGDGGRRRRRRCAGPRPRLAARPVPLRRGAVGPVGVHRRRRPAT